MDSYMVQGGNAWDAQSFDGQFGSHGAQVRDQYFEKDDEGYYKLKDGYEQRYQGENSGNSGAEMVYSNDYDDLEYPEEARYYGIYKTPEPEPAATNTVQAEQPVEVPEQKALPIKLSNRAAEAIAATTAYEDKMLPRQGDSTIKNDKTVAQDFKDSYSINLTNQLKDQAPGVLEAKANDIKQNDAYSLNLVKQKFLQ